MQKTEHQITFETATLAKHYGLEIRLEELAIDEIAESVRKSHALEKAEVIVRFGGEERTFSFSEFFRALGLTWEQSDTPR